ncbi:MAG: hypothetical protein HOE90_02715 [Bacteriovoracaceae bacterium]|nr:hypothetical protein [Bacteriovoracaceae bacterium]
MPVCLLIEDREKVAALNSLNLRVYVGLEVIWMKNTEDAMRVLDVVPNIDLIITRAKIKSCNSAVEITEKMQISGKKIPMIVIGSDPHLDKTIRCLASSVDIFKLVRITAQMMGVTAQEMLEKVVPDYYSIPLRYFKYINNIICEVYIKISNDSDNFQFIKVANAGEGEKLSVSAIAGFAKKGVKDLFILCQNRLKFVTAFTNEIVPQLYNEKLSVSERFELNEISFDFVSADIGKVGLNEDIVKMSKAGIQSVVKFSDQFIGTKIKNLLSTMISKPGSYKFKMAQLTHILASHAIRERSWGTQEHIDKLGYVSFFHDVLIPNDQMAKVLTNGECEILKPKPHELNILNNHALWTQELLDKYPEAKMGVNILIRQHHGSLTGVGYPDSYSTRLSPLSIVFIASEFYAREVLENTNDFSHHKILENLHHLMNCHKYREVLESFDSIYKVKKAS